MAAAHGAASHVVERRGVLAPQPPEPRIPLHNFFRAYRPAAWPDRLRRATRARRACTDRWDRARGGSAGPGGPARWPRTTWPTPSCRRHTSSATPRPPCTDRDAAAPAAADSTHPTNRAVAISVIRSGGRVRYARMKTVGARDVLALSVPQMGRGGKRNFGWRQPPAPTETCERLASTRVELAADHFASVAPYTTIHYLACSSLSNAASKATLLGSKSSLLTNSQASLAPCSRSMPPSSHSTDSGPV